MIRLQVSRGERRFTVHSVSVWTFITFRAAISEDYDWKAKEKITMDSSTAFRIRLWAIIGPSDSGKSSTIGALISQSGKGPGGLRDVLLRGGGWLRIMALRQSLQEAKQKPESVSEKFSKAAHKQERNTAFAYYNLLIALRSDQVNGCPIADEYLSHFVEAGWEIQSLVLLEDEIEYGRYIAFGAPLALIPKSAKMTSNQLERNWVFGQVRNHFGWA
jgi:hypothetical protein